MRRTRRMLIMATWVILFSFAALSVATYAWMSIATSYKVSDLELNIITENAMEVAPDEGGQPGEWLKVLSTEQLIDPELGLRPVTWSAKDKSFYAPTYGLDGRIDFFDPHLITSINADIPTPSPAEAEEEAGAGYLISVDFWLRTGAAKITTYLSGPAATGPDSVGDGTYVIGAPEWDAEKGYHINGGNGAEYAIRIGFLTYDYYNEETGKLLEESRFYIYEPNTAADAAFTPNLDGEPLEGDGKLIRQENSYFTEQEIPLHGSVDYVRGAFIGNDSEMFTLYADIPRRVTMFIWLEGQDAECTNAISAGHILANLQFAASLRNNDENIGRPEGGAD